MAKGKFITIYGINNIGKSTHAQILTERLIAEGYDVEFLKYPNYAMEPSGPFLDHVLRGDEKQSLSEEELQLWFVLNRFQFQPEIEKKLAEGKILIVEDYIGTGIAWGMAKGLKREWLECVNAPLLKEDFSIYLRGRRKETAIEDRHIHERNEELIGKCLKTHEELCTDYKWNVVEMEEEITETAGLIWVEVEGFLKK